MAEGYFNKLISSIRGLGAPRWEGPITNPNHTYEGRFNRGDDLSLYQAMMSLPRPLAGQRESRNVLDVRGRAGEGIGDVFDRWVINPPRGYPRSLQTLEQISGGLPNIPADWFKR
jgi:hypothetical protein